MKKGPHRGPFLVFGATLDLEKAAPGGRVSASAGLLLDLAFMTFIAGSCVLDGADFATAGLANLLAVWPHPSVGAQRGQQA
jgi:hypothetical protein